MAEAAKRRPAFTVAARCPAAFARGQGHVALFLAETADKVLVLGGNQKSLAGHQAVCRKWLAKRDGERQLHSYHAIRALRSAA